MQERGVTGIDWLQVLQARCDATPALTLVCGRDEVLRWSYAELQAQRRYCERVFLDLGLQCGDRVLISCSNNPQFFAVLLAALALDLCLMPLHVDTADTQLQKLLQQQRPRLVIIDRTRAPERFQHCCVWQIQEQSEEWLQPVQAMPSLLNGESSTSVEAGGHGAVLFHSSGSTGTPKGMRYDRNALNTFIDYLNLLYAGLPDLPAAEALSPRVNVLPVTHWGGLNSCLHALIEGRSLYLLRSDHAADHVHLLQRTRCQLLILVPALLHELLADEAVALPHLRHCLAMGEAISQAQLQQLSDRLGMRVINAYGMSECLTGIFNCHDDEAMPPSTCGRQRFGEVKLIDSGGASQLTEGELCVRNATTQPLYTDAALNQQKYHDGWYHTGDRFRRDAAGYYFFVGRVDDMCVINGRNIFQREVEQVFLQHPAVAACVVTKLLDHAGRTRLAAAIELRDGLTTSVNNLLDFYLKHGAVFATPSWLEIREQLPRNNGDKPDRPRIAHELQHHFERSLQVYEGAA